MHSFLVFSHLRMVIKVVAHWVRSRVHGGVDDLQDADAEGGCLASARLRLRNGIATLAYLNDGTRLHRRRRLIAVSIDAAQKVLFQVLMQLLARSLKT